MQNSDKTMFLVKLFSERAPSLVLRPGDQGHISAEDCHPEDEESWEALDKLLGWSYWRRTWILQELALAEQIGNALPFSRYYYFPIPNRKLGR
jgi:hypothetical protein